MKSDTLIDIGKIVSAHGLNGEVNYIPFNASSELPKPGMTVTLRFPGEKTGEAVIVSIRDKVKFRLLTVAGVGDRAAAEKLRGAIVACPRAVLPEPAEGEFYYSDILGLPVTYPDGALVGTVTQVLSLATDVIEITSPTGDECMVPVAEGFVRSITRTGVVIEPGALEME